MRKLLLSAIALFAVQLCHGATAQTSDADSDLVDQGRYLVTAGDCAGCHGTSFEGGDPVPSPVGSIYASNITPDVETGIGSWSLKQFSDVLRKGKGPKGHVYPAMPYTSYTGLKDDQIQAIYSYLMLDVEPVSNEPPATNLGLPFIRPAMIAWNTLFLNEGQPIGAINVEGEQKLRGRLLVETLGHCTTCHTPRKQLMQQDSKRHLAGAMVGGWWAPNITPDKSGIGDWSDDQLSEFLTTGHTDVAVAAGEMATVVSRSLSKLSPDDVNAMIAYLRAVPAVASNQPEKLASSSRDGIQVTAIEPADQISWQAMLGHDTTRGDTLYQAACSSCHGVDGKGSKDLKRPSLHQIGSVTGPHGATLVQVIAHGVNRKIGDEHTLMPGFRNSMNNAQIASLTSYVRSEFGGVESSLDENQVKAILEGRNNTPWLIRNAQWLTILAFIVAALVLLAIAWTIIRAFGRR